MSLLFGKLTASFVSFGQATVNARAPGASPEVIQAFEAARAHFRTEAAKDASYLVYIGIGMFFTTYGYMLIWVDHPHVSRFHRYSRLAWTIDVHC